MKTNCLCRVEAQKAAATDKKGKKAKTEPSAVSAASAVAPTKGKNSSLQKV